MVALLGRNGMGKTTTVHTIMGLLPATGGSITIDREPVAGEKPFRIARRGLGLVPEGRQVFPTLTAEENSSSPPPAPAHGPCGPSSRSFPACTNAGTGLAGCSSGGEQQMLAIARALMTNPRLLILDEATEGLAPLIREEIWRCLARLKEQGMGILLIDKTLDTLLKLADRHVIIEKGVTVWSGSSAELEVALLRDRYLHI